MLASIAHAASALPVVDLDGTMWIQGGLFVTLIFILNPLLFQPWLAAQARRSKSIEGALADAQELEAKARLLGDDYDRKRDQARDAAHADRSQQRRAQEAETAEKLAGIRDEANAGLEAERKRIADEADKARTALQGRVDELAKDIANKLLGRAS